MSNRIKRVLSAAAAILAISAPAVAYARPNLNPVPTVASVPVHRVVLADGQRATAPSGFRWDDAALGAAGVVVLAGLGSGAMVIRQRRTHRPLTS